MLKNLEELYARADDTAKEEGELAYPRYHGVMQAFADFYGFGIVPAVEAFAATSPNSDYHGNLRSMASVLDAVRNKYPRETVTTSCFKGCALRAYSYVTGEVSFLDTVGGPKITAFRHNLLYPETSKYVTVDGHMVAAWFGQSMTMKQASKRMNARVYKEVSDGITKLARRHKMQPCAMQAVLWIARKQEGAIKYPMQYHLYHGATDLSRIVCDPRDYPPYKRKLIG